MIVPLHHTCPHHEHAHRSAATSINKSASPHARTSESHHKHAHGSAATSIHNSASSQACTSECQSPRACTSECHHKQAYQRDTTSMHIRERHHKQAHGSATSCIHNSASPQACTSESHHKHAQHNASTNPVSDRVVPIPVFSCKERSHRVLRGRESSACRRST
jgi:hypothetical protein